MDNEPTWWQRLLKLDPALVRGFVTALAGILAVVLGHTVIDDDTVQNILDAFTAVTALVAALWIRPAVTPNAKVVVRDDTPLDIESTIVPGEATVVTSDPLAQQALLTAAATKEL